jgi:hypothetical protein
VLVASTCVIVFALSFWIRASLGDRPLDSGEINRIRRLSERLRREELRLFE